MYRINHSPMHEKLLLSITEIGAPGDGRQRGQLRLHAFDSWASQLQRPTAFRPAPSEDAMRSDVRSSSLSRQCITLNSTPGVNMSTMSPRMVPVRRRGWANLMVSLSIQHIHTSQPMPTTPVGLSRRQCYLRRDETSCWGGVVLVDETSCRSWSLDGCERE